MNELMLDESSGGLLAETWKSKCFELTVMGN